MASLLKSVGLVDTISKRTTNAPSIWRVPRKHIGYGVYHACNCDWWCEFDARLDQDPAANAQRWDIIATWSARIAKVLDKHFADPKLSVVCWKIRFASDLVLAKPAEKHETSFEKICDDIKAEIDHVNSTVILDVGQEFEYGLGYSENIAESALVYTTIKAFANLFKIDLTASDLEDLHRAVVPCSMARQAHQLTAQTFRDYVAHTASAKPIFVNTIDDATDRIGIGWLSGEVEKTRTVKGVETCNQLLAKVVQKIENEICEELSLFNREAVLTRLIENHEVSAIERDQWRRTSGALLALRDGAPIVRSTVINHEAKTNSACLTSRILAEIAVCESPIEGGLIPSDLELGRLIAKAMSVFNVGGISNAIRWNAMAPAVLVTPMGDIHVDQSFVEDVMSRVGEAHGEITIETAVADYDTNFKNEKTISKVVPRFDKAFLDAWEEEFGRSLDDTCHFVDLIESYSIERVELVFSVKKSTLRNHFEREKKAGLFDSLIDRFSLQARDEWRTVPDGFIDRDRQPWSFRRRLSLMRRPIVAFEKNDESQLILAPGLIRDAFAHMVRCFHKGDIPKNQIASKKMRSWSGKAADVRGAKFALEVAEKMKQLGWQVAHAELKVTKLLEKGFELDYGDVDVFAWNPETGEVLLIECKDVQFRKTHGEIAEQLLKFKGKVKANGKRDELRKHLDRVDQISKHLSRVAKFCKIEKPILKPILLFRNPVPMQYASDEMSHLIKVNIFSDLEKEYLLLRTS